MPAEPTDKMQRRQLSKILGLDAARLCHQGNAPHEVTGLEADLLELWRRLLKCDSIGLDDDFCEKGGDSFLAFQMLLELEHMVGHRVPESILLHHSTIRRLEQGLARLDLSRSTPLVHMQAKGDRPPFFFFHGDYAGGLYTRRLARLLGPNQPFISVDPHGLGPEPIPSSIEQMAADRLPLVLAAQPQGPFRLGGYCNGGMVGLEVAHLLLRAGQRVELVVLVDTPILNLRPIVRIAHQSIVKVLSIAGKEDREQANPRLVSAMDALWRQWSNLAEMPLALYSATLLHGLRRRLSGIFGYADADRSDVASTFMQVRGELTSRHRRLVSVYNQLFRRYFPKAIEAPIIYFSADYTGKLSHRLGPSVEMVAVPGGHWGCITSHVDVLARHLRRRLEQLSSPDLPNPPQQWDDTGGGGSPAPAPGRRAGNDPTASPEPGTHSAASEWRQRDPRGHATVEMRH
jgi:oxalate---CoA ligase